MATRTAKKTVEKPAAKPAAEKPAADEGVTLKDLASELGRDPKSVRAAIRRIKGGPQVGQGGRYHWDSKSDPDYKELVAALKGKGKEEA